MPTVRHIITSHWRELPAEVLNYGAFTNAAKGEPTRRVQRTILVSLLATTAEGYSFAARHWTRAHEQSPAVEEAIGNQLRRAGGRLAAAAAWHRILLDEYPEWVAERGSEPASDPSEWVMVPSLDLARRFGAPGDEAAEAARAAMEHKAGRPLGPTAEDMQRYLRQHADELNDLLDETWRRVSAAGDDDTSELNEVLDAFHESAHTAYLEKWDPSSAARKTAVRAWERLCELAADGAGVSLVTLSATNPPARPALLGSAPGAESPPLDRPIADRLSRMFKSPAVVVQHLDDVGPENPPSFAVVTAQSMAERTISAGAEPFGMDEPTARALLLVAARTVKNLGWQPDRRARDTVRGEFTSASEHYFFSRWDRIGWHHARYAHPGTTLGRLLESPAPLFLGRMWTRAARTQFQEPEWRPDARMAWDHNRGNFWSVYDDTLSVYRYAQQVGTVAEHDDEHTIPDLPDVGPAPVDGPRPELGALDTVIQSVLDVGRTLDGEDAVLDFLLATEDGETRPEESWDRWIAEAGHPDEEYPSFDQVQQHLQRRRPLHDDLVEGRPPTLEDAEAIIAFVRRSGGRSADAVSRFLERVTAAGEPPWPERDVTLWDQWGQRFARHQRDHRSGEHVIPTFAQLVALLRDARVRTLAERRRTDEGDDGAAGSE